MYYVFERTEGRLFLRTFKGHCPSFVGTQWCQVASTTFSSSVDADANQLLRHSRFVGDGASALGKFSAKKPLLGDLSRYRILSKLWTLSMSRTPQLGKILSAFYFCGTAFHLRMVESQKEDQNINLDRLKPLGISGTLLWKVTRRYTNLKTKHPFRNDNL